MPPISVKPLAKLFARKHTPVIFQALSERDRSFMELAEMTKPNSVYVIMKDAEGLGLVKRYTKDRQTMFKLKRKGIVAKISEKGVRVGFI